jgi:hypothetical protein
VSCKRVRLGRRRQEYRSHVRFVNVANASAPPRVLILDQIPLTLDRYNVQLHSGLGECQRLAAHIGRDEQRPGCGQHDLIGHLRGRWGGDEHRGKDKNGALHWGAPVPAHYA